MISVNATGAAGITEMLLQSQGGTLRFLPALPAEWSEGSVKGLRARGGFGVDIDWSDASFQSAVLRSDLGRRCVIAADQPLRITSQGREVAFTENGDSISFETSAGAVYRVAPRLP